MTSLGCLCFASIDRFFVSCRSVTWRNRSKLSTAKIATFIAILVILASNVPLTLSYAIIKVNAIAICSLINSDLAFYVSYILRPVFLSILPDIVLGITGWFTYRNITSISGVQLRGTFQRSLTSMMLLQIVTVIIPIIPFATINVYLIITTLILMVKSFYRSAQEALVFNSIGTVTREQIELNTASMIKQIPRSVNQTNQRTMA